MKALAVFTDPDSAAGLKQDSTTWFQAWLKPGFRHVLVAVDVGGIAVVLDPAAGGLHLWAAETGLDYVADHYRSIGAIVVETEAEPGGALYPTRMTCVEVVKRMLGVRGLFVLTPYQLYRRLTWVS